MKLRTDANIDKFTMHKMSWAVLLIYIKGIEYTAVLKQILYEILMGIKGKNVVI